MERLSRAELSQMSDHDLLVRSAVRLEDLGNDVEHLTQQVARINGRVRGLEAWRTALGGGLAVLIVLLGLVMPWLLGKI